MSATASSTGTVRRVLLIILAALGGLTLLFFMGMIVIASIVSLTREGVPRTTVLELDLERGVQEHVPDDPLSAALGDRALTVRDIVDALHRARDDDRVHAVVARIGAGGMGFARAEEIRDAVLAFRESGKPAVVFSETFGEFGPGHSGYYLATAFERIYLQPSGDVGLAGLVAEGMFLSGTLDKLDVEPRIEQRYEYKNAANTFNETEFTEAHAEATGRVLESIFENMVSGISQGREMDQARVSALIDRGPFVAGEALQAGLVDRLAYRDEVYDSLRAEFGDRTRFLYAKRYLDRAGRPHRRGPTVALIYGVGAVVRGDGGFNPLTGTSMASDRVTRAFREAIEDDDVTAIVFRVDSPGGSYVASDAIWRETVRARDAGKPVIVTMGDVAASGGYFVAIDADRIIAQPSTITGSIGVLGGKMITTGLWDQVGVSWDELTVGGNATIWSTISDYTPEEFARTEAILDRIYDDFTGKVAAGRGMTQDDVHEIARGRIWTGVDAQRVGLVDDLGGFTTAFFHARELTGLEPDADIRVRVFPERRTLLESLLDRGPDSSQPTATQALARMMVETLQPMAALARRTGLIDPPGALTMPELEIRR